MRVIFTVCWVLLLPVEAFAASTPYAIDPERSQVTVELGKTGIFGFLGDRHLISAPIASGEIRLEPDLAASSVRLRFDAASLKALDPELGADDRAKVQAKMESGEVLGVSEFPSIDFESTRVAVQAPDRLLITGRLTLRRVSRDIEVRCRLERGDGWLKVVGESKFKQTRFGLQPVAAGLGTVKVKDEIVVRFEVYAAVR